MSALTTYVYYYGGARKMRNRRKAADEAAELEAQEGSKSESNAMTRFKNAARAETDRAKSGKQSLNS